MSKYFLIFLVSCNKSMFKRLNPSNSSSSTDILFLNCATAADSNDVFSATEWNSFSSGLNSYLIFTAEQLLSLSGQAKLINTHIELCANIDLQPLYDAAVPHFMLPGLDQNSSFNGNNFTISNFTFIATNPIYYESVALFRGGAANDPDFGGSLVISLIGINRGTIKDLVLENLYISANSTYIAGISPIQQMNPITNVHVSGTLESNSTITPVNSSMGGIVAGIELSTYLTADNIYSSDYLFNNNSTNVDLKYSNDGTVIDNEHQFYQGGLIGLIMLGKTDTTEQRKIDLKNNFTNFTTQGNAYGRGMIGGVLGTLCAITPAIPNEQCMILNIENSYSISNNAINSTETVARNNYVAGMIGVLSPILTHKTFFTNVFSSVLATNDNPTYITPFVDYSTTVIDPIVETISFTNSFGVSPGFLGITSNYLDNALQADTYFFINTNAPLNSWDPLVWSYDGITYPTLF